LVWRCVDDDELLRTAAETAGRAAAVPPALSRRLKETLAMMATVADHDTAVTVELEAQLWSMAQPDFAERLAATRRRITSR
jgi:enoyl-CoA hydratase